MNIIQIKKNENDTMAIRDQKTQKQEIVNVKCKKQDQMVKANKDEEDSYLNFCILFNIRVNILAKC